ncbi:ornithine aminotransferase [Beutenbergia cavernae DSM 12333]|uniref:ornithine aminotransferase n=1 Tax=Beutenbergia cavernae (strain ATCC BAA-8 / DSM 12333 / CCUG 43141 / JCM 11478 / NBRC 16432 / NCIMB 13614 / HKI 0122) TaxID=471853 RepID=C5BZH5_BEUC1|nr:ornithine--oxo-acid transaminase [Beutenbergia cavernae]ACQ79147.1 ornithine aminotransferase [Beutenbergia cavernae DSM 12333]
MTADVRLATGSTAPGREVLAHNYAPLPVTLHSGDGAWVRDAQGRAYLDFLAGYSALNFGHGHPALLAAAHDQLDRLTLTSRAFDHDLLVPFADAVTALTGTQMLLPMNTGAEAVETAIKVSRKWGYDVRGVAPERATIVVAAGAFHGRTTTIVSFSTDPDARDGFGPYTPGFRVVPYGDADAVAAAIDEHTVAVLLEPIQGESGVVVPPADYLPRVRDVTAAAGVLLVLDEIQSGLGRTGTTLAADRVGVRADLVTLGKALGGGVLPVSAVVGRADVLGVLTPGTHGSTFGGNPLACAVGIAVCRLLEPGDLQARAAELGAVMAARLEEMQRAGLLAAVRTAGLWAGIDVPADAGITGRGLCERLLARGVLAKDTHGATIRLAPPLVVSEADLHTGLDALEDALRA